MIKIYKKSFDDHIEWRREDNNLLHREGGPAIEWANGNKYWCYNGKLHRADGPAVQFLENIKQYHLNGKFYPGINSDEEWIIFQIIN